MLRNNTRIIAFNPRFSKLVTKEYLKKLAGTRKNSSSSSPSPSPNSNEQRAKNDNVRPATPIVQQLEDDFTQRLGKSRNARVGEVDTGCSSTSSESSSDSNTYKPGHHPTQFEYRRALRKRSQSLREHRSRQLLSVLHEEEIIAPPPPSSSILDTPRRSSVDGLNENMLMRTRNAKATSSSFGRFHHRSGSNGGCTNGAVSGTSGTSGHKRQHWKPRPKGLRSRMVATLVVLKDHYQHLLSSLNGEEVRREYSNLDGMVVNPKYDLQFADDLHLHPRHDDDFEHDSAVSEYRSVKVRFKRSLSCKV
ncbi:hypothetical protein Mapa_005904 [Marchantia paleacea]|nr:hypothetical protein Mapa_005904 [Marchantia paleacea]